MHCADTRWRLALCCEHTWALRHLAQGSPLNITLDGPCCACPCCACCLTHVPSPPRRYFNKRDPVEVLEADPDLVRRAQVGGAAGGGVRVWERG